MTITPIALSLSTYSTPPQTSDPANFDPRADLLFGTELPRGVSEWNAIVGAINVMIGQMNVDTADVTTKQGIASTAATNSSNSAAAALTSQNAAAASAAAALGAPGTNATSTTSRALGTGANTITIQTGKLYTEGQTFSIASASDPANKVMYATATAYNSGTGVLSYNVASADHVKGSGTYADWKVALCPLPGATGPAGSAGVISRGRRSIIGADTIGQPALGQLITLSSAISADCTVAMDTPTNLGANWFITLANESAFTVTLTCSSIDGGTSKKVFPGEVYELQGDGSSVDTMRIAGRGTFGAIGSANVVSTSVNGNFIAVGAMSATRAFVCHKNSSGYAHMTLIDETGAAIANSVVGFAATLNDRPVVVALDASSVMVLCTESSTPACRAQIVSFSGSTISFGTPMVFYSSSTPSMMAGVKLSSTKVVAFWNDSSGGECVCLTVSGSTITAGTKITFYGNSLNSLSVCAINSTQMLAVGSWAASQPSLQAAVVTEASGVLTAGSSQILSYHGQSGIAYLGYGSCVAMGANNRALVTGGYYKLNSSVGLCYTVDVSGTGGSAVMHVGKQSSCPTMEGGGAGPLSTILQISAETYVRANMTLSGRASGSLEVFKVKGRSASYDPEPSCTPADYCVTFASCLMGSAIMVVYNDQLNGGYPTARAVQLGSIS